ncbi:MAG TPA: DUF2752 domain-containing protein [Moheibacter sp.]|nr:DUF2752 domain-containing protein [Moheibacter sp.]
MSKSSKKIWVATALFVAVAALIYYVFQHDPSDQNNLYIGCTFKTLTGWDCSGCGGQRAFYHLLHWDIVEAWRYNALLVFSLPYLAVVTFYELRAYFFNRPKPKNWFTSNTLLWIFLALLLLFGLLRNLPIAPFSSWATPR